LIVFRILNGVLNNNGIYFGLTYLLAEIILIGFASVPLAYRNADPKIKIATTGLMIELIIGDENPLYSFILKAGYKRIRIKIDAIHIKAIYQ
jgi:hypothetical protein